MGFIGAQHQCQQGKMWKKPLKIQRERSTPFIVYCVQKVGKKDIKKGK